MYICLILAMRVLFVKKGGGFFTGYTGFSDNFQIIGQDFVEDGRKNGGNSDGVDIRTAVCISTPSLFSIEGILYIYYFSICFFASKKSLVSFATTPLKANRAIMFGKAMRPFTISARVQTALTVMKGPAKTMRM